MPLRDHFRPPLADFASWEELHGAWPSAIAFRLNAILPSEYRSGVRVHIGNAIEVDVASFENEVHARPNGGSIQGEALGWSPSPPTMLLESELPTPPEYEVQVYDMRRARRLVAAVEIVSPGNKDRPESRDAFVSKCHALLQQDVCVAIVDPVTDRATNLYAELAERIGADPPSIGSAAIYAVSCRGRAMGGRWRVESWPHELRIGDPLPTLPLWLTDSLFVPLELEETYEETCRGLRIG